MRVLPRSSSVFARQLSSTSLPFSVSEPSIPFSQTRFSPSFRIVAARDPCAREDDPLLIIKPLKKIISPLAVVRNNARGVTQRAAKKVALTAKLGSYYIITPNLCALLMPIQNLEQEFASILIDMNLHTSATREFVHNVKYVMKCRRQPVPVVDGIALALLARAKEDKIEAEMSWMLRKMLEDLMTDHNLFEIVCCPALGDSPTLNEKKKAFAALTSRIPFNMYLERMIKLVFRLHHPHLVDIALAYLALEKEMMSDLSDTNQETPDLEYTKFLMDAVLKHD